MIKRQIIKIADMLPTGKVNAVSMRNLASALEMNERDVRRVIERERKAGALIASSTEYNASGYFIPASQDELREFIRFMERRNETTTACIRAAKLALGEGEV